MIWRLASPNHERGLGVTCPCGYQPDRVSTLAEQNLTYSCGTALIGSIRDALRPGMYPATNAAPTSIPTADRSACGSLCIIPYKNDPANFEVTMAMPAPIASPTAANASTSRRIIRTTIPRCAPSAIRVPISLVRRSTE